MSLANSTAGYGAVARTFHWLTALLIFTAFPLGMIAERLPYDTSEALARKAQLFSIHKTLGTLVFFVALGRILWALSQPRPLPLHPDRRAETFLAELVHWALYISLVAVPLSGWVHHAAVEGFAPILWPFGQGLPFVPRSETVAQIATAMHWLFTKVLLAAVALHIAGALKHVLIDRDGTLGRMVRGTPAPAAAAPATRPHRSHAPMLAAVAIYALAFGAAWQMAQRGTTGAPAETAAGNPPPAAPATAGNWQVETGTLGFVVRQMGSEVEGRFAAWAADITFDEVPVDGLNGTVTVTIDTTSLTLGSVTDQAKGAEFFDSASFPAAVFSATILPAAQGEEARGYEARGTLTLRGAEKPVTLPFTLTIDGDLATMQGETTLDRRDFGMGASYGDESSVGFTVRVVVNLTARRIP